MSGYAEFKRGWGIVLSSAVGIGTSVTTLLAYTAGVFVKPLADEFGWQDHQILASYTIVLVLASASNPVIGRLTDKVGARRVAIGAVIALGLSWMLLALTPKSLAVFYGCFGLMAIVGTGTLPVTWTAAVIRAFNERRGLALGLCMVSTGILGIGAKFYAYFLITRLGWRVAFVGMGALLLGVTLPITVMLFRERREEGSVAVTRGPEGATTAVGLTLAAAFRTRQFWTLCAVFFLLSLSAGISTNLERFLSASGFPVGLSVNIAAFYGLGIVVARLLTGYCIDRIWAPAVVFGIVLPAVASHVLLALDPDPSPSIAAACVFFLGFGPGAEYDALAYLTARYFGARAYSSIYGSIYIAFALGAGLGPYGFSKLLALQASHRAVLFAFAAILLAGAGLCLTLGRYRASKQSGSPPGGDTLPYRRRELTD